MQVIAGACESGQVPGSVALVVSTTPDAPALERANALGVEGLFLDLAVDAGAEDDRIAREFEARGVDVVCLTGYMRLLSREFLSRYPQRVLNVHPSLLPCFGGKGFYGRRVHEAVLESGARFTGATIHFVDAEYDHGPILLQSVTPVMDDDTPKSLADRVLVEEHRLYPEALRLVATADLQFEGRRVRVRS